MKLILLAALFMTSNAFTQVVITDSGSTNRPGLTVTIGAKGKAELENRQGTKMKMSLEADLHKRLMADVEAAMPLDQLNAHHCMKSVSFGSSTFVTYKGVRSPDISCPGQTDPAVIALQKDVEEIMSQAKPRMPQTRQNR